MVKGKKLGIGMEIAFKLFLKYEALSKKALIQKEPASNSR